MVATARHREGETGISDWIAPLFALVVGAVILTYGLEAAKSPTVQRAGVPVGMYFFMGSVALLSAAGDVRMLVRGAFSVDNDSYDIFGACALRCSWPQVPFSWDRAARYFRLL
jgi:hypothetical protein